MSHAAGLRTIAMCADDFGLSVAVDAAVMNLAKQGRVQAISCMVGAANWREEAKRLKDAPAGLSVGLHIVLTRVAYPAKDGEGLGGTSDSGPGRLLVRAFLGRIDRHQMADRIDRQLGRFEATTGRRPDHVDGHHHVHAMPGVAEILCERLVGHYGNQLPWLRMLSPCLPSPTARLRRNVIAYLGHHQRRVLAHVPIGTNVAFGGVRSFHETRTYGEFLRSQLAAVTSDNTLIMCHPGLPSRDSVDDEIAASRMGEYEFLAGPDFPALLSELDCRLSPIVPRRIDGASG